MSVAKKRISISLHPIKLTTFDRITDKYWETSSGMFTRLIQEFPDKEYRNVHDFSEPTEISYYTPKKRKMSPKEYVDIEEVGDISNK